jgi:uncharacterized repeat protein (TIGR04052 family)
MMRTPVPTKKLSLPLSWLLALAAGCSGADDQHGRDESSVKHEDAATSADDRDSADAPAQDCGRACDAQDDDAALSPGDAAAASDAGLGDSPDTGAGLDAGSERDASALPDAQASDGASLDSAARDAGPQRRVTIRFKAEVSGQAFACGQTYANQGSTRVMATPTDLRFFVQDLRLINAAGADVPVRMDTRSPWQVPELALIDFENAQGSCASGNAGTNLEITGEVPVGSYAGVAFKNGVPAALNHADPALAPAPLKNAPGAYWSWALGYKFLIAELHQVVPAGQIPGTAGVHVGSAACSGDVCGRPNRNEIRLSGFNPDSSVIVVDLGTIHAGSDLTMEAQCHSFGTSCPAPFTALGIDYDTGLPLATQGAFKVR